MGVAVKIEFSQQQFKCDTVEKQLAIRSVFLIWTAYLCRTRGERQPGDTGELKNGVKLTGLWLDHFKKGDLYPCSRCYA